MTWLALILGLITSMSIEEWCKKYLINSGKIKFNNKKKKRNIWSKCSELFDFENCWAETFTELSSFCHPWSLSASESFWPWAMSGQVFIPDCQLPATEQFTFPGQFLSAFNFSSFLRYCHLSVFCPDTSLGIQRCSSPECSFLSFINLQLRSGEETWYLRKSDLKESNFVFLWQTHFQH